MSGYLRMMADGTLSTGPGGNGNGKSKEIVLMKEQEVESGQEVKKVEVPVRCRDGFEYTMREDGRMWAWKTLFGARIWTPCRFEEVLERYGAASQNPEEVEMECLMEGQVDPEWLLPESVLARWGRQLLECEGEAFCVYGRDRRNPVKWMAVVPEQETSSGGVDIDELGVALEALAQLGCRRVGTVHTHPGSMTGFSTTDRDDMFSVMGGIHWIVAKSRQFAGYLALNGEAVFRLKEGQIRGRGSGMAFRGPGGEHGWAQVKPLIKKKTWGYAPGGYRGTGGTTRWVNGRQERWDYTTRSWVPEKAPGTHSKWDPQTRRWNEPKTDRLEDKLSEEDGRIRWDPDLYDWVPIDNGVEEDTDSFDPSARWDRPETFNRKAEQLASKVREAMVLSRELETYDQGPQANELWGDVQGQLEDLAWTLEMLGIGTE